MEAKVLTSEVASVDIMVDDIAPSKSVMVGMEEPMVGDMMMSSEDNNSLSNNVILGIVIAVCVILGIVLGIIFGKRAANK